MNERIRELAEQATIKTSYQYQTWGDRIATGHKEQFDKEKFAQLIIAECIAAHEDDYGADIIGDVLKKHFGVEE